MNFSLDSSDFDNGSYDTTAIGHKVCLSLSGFLISSADLKEVR